VKALAALGGGLDETDRSGRPIRYRLIDPSDDLDDVTAMLHEAYAPLARAGMRFVASHQDVETTRRRVASGVTVVALDGERVVGIVTVRDPGVKGGSAHYSRPDVATFGQLAVRPSHQGRGIGGRLLALVEEIARQRGAAELALDTSEHAAHLIALYEAKGYRFVEHTKWDAVNYRSVVMSKVLGPPRAASSGRPDVLVDLPAPHHELDAP
jgi:GNAT superfamily N-acetyltransferase